MQNRHQRYRRAASEEPEPEKDERDQGNGRRYQAADRPKTVGGAAERNAGDVHAPNARDQRRRQEYRRERRKYVNVSVGLLLDLRAQLFEQELTLLRVLLRILDQRRVAMDLAVEAVEFVGGKRRRTLARQLEHGRALVGPVAGDPDRDPSHLHEILALAGAAPFQHLRLHGP